MRPEKVEDNTLLENQQKLSADGKYWEISVGTKCSKVYCNLKIGGSVVKYREFKCVDQDKELGDFFLKKRNPTLKIL